MKVVTIDGRDYRLPGNLNDFQLEMYVHLINWKWEHITTEAGYYKYKRQLIPYDAILPKTMSHDFRIIYPPAVDELRRHQKKFPFRQHIHFNHMASSQAANVNLFLPVLRHPEVNAAILGAIKPDFKCLATSYLDNGYRIEFWDEPYGNLGDKTMWCGTDSDIAIAYYNHDGQLCLWLIEHKLTEKEFTECGGFKSDGREPRHDCDKCFGDLVGNPAACYYHDVRKFNYWTLTQAHQAFFVNHGNHASCPFRGGMNQLWRNQLLALSVQHDDRQPFERVSFSVVKHPRNQHLDPTLTAYRHLIADNPSFSVFTSVEVLTAAANIRDAALDGWVAWYRGLYKV